MPTSESRPTWGIRAQYPCSPQRTISQKKAPDMPRANYKRTAITPVSRRLIEQMQWIRFGQIEDLTVRNGQPVFGPDTRIVRKHKIGGQNGPCRRVPLEALARNAKIIELFDCLSSLGDGLVRILIVQDGLPHCLDIVSAPDAYPSSGRPKLAADQKPKSAACNLHSQAWSSPLAGFLRCSCRQTVGTYPETEAFSRVFGGAETDAETLSAMPTHTLDTGQFFSAWHTGCSKVVLPKQCSFDMDTDECLMAQSNRMPVHSG